METLNKLKGAQSIHRAVALMRAIADRNDEGVKLTELSNQTGLHIDTGRRILKALELEGLIDFNHETKEYKLGYGLFRLGYKARRYSIRDRFRSSLLRIAKQTEDTVFLLIRSGYEVLCLDRVEGEFPIRIVTIDIGTRRPLGIGAGSLALIAFLKQDEFESIIIANKDRYHQYKGLICDDIRNLASDARDKGYVVSKGLFHDNIVSVGVPIFSNKNELVAAITVSAISERMDTERQKRIVKCVREIVAAEGAIP